MANPFINKFLNDESLEALENSEGAIYAIKKPSEAEKIREEYLSYLAEYNKYDALIREYHKKLESLEKQKHFHGMFKTKESKEQKKQLENAIKEANKQKDLLISKINPLYNQYIMIEKEIKSFEKSLLLYGLTLKEIKEEYYRILAKLKPQGQSSTEEVQQCEDKKDKDSQNNVVVFDMVQTSGQQQYQA